MDGSTAYLHAARDEARRQGHIDRISYRHGDFVELLRVLCCYPDMPALVCASASRARRSYALIYPRSTWWMRAAAIAFDAFRPVAGQGSGPGFVHPERDVDAAVRKEGFIPIVNDSTLYWRVVLYRRVKPAAAPRLPSAQPGRSRSGGPT